MGLRKYLAHTKNAIAANKTTAGIEIINTNAKLSATHCELAAPICAVERIEFNSADAYMYANTRLFTISQSKKKMWPIIADERLAVSIIATLLCLAPVIAILRYWIQEEGKLETTLRVVRIAASLFLLGVYYEHIDNEYLWKYFKHIGHPPGMGESDHVYAVMQVWCHTAIIYLTTVLVSYFATGNTTYLLQGHLVLLERAVTVYYFSNPSCVSRVLTDIGLSLASSVLNRQQSKGKESRKDLEKVACWFRTCVASFLVAQMIIFIIIKSSVNADDDHIVPGTTHHTKQILFALWQIIMIVLQWTVSSITILPGTPLKEA